MSWRIMTPQSENLRQQQLCTICGWKIGKLEEPIKNWEVIFGASTDVDLIRM